MKTPYSGYESPQHVRQRSVKLTKICKVFRSWGFPADILLPGDAQAPYVSVTIPDEDNRTFHITEHGTITEVTKQTHNVRAIGYIVACALDGIYNKKGGEKIFDGT